MKKDCDDNWHPGVWDRNLDFRKKRNMKKGLRWQQTSWCIRKAVYLASSNVSSWLRLATPRHVQSSHCCRKSASHNTTSILSKICSMLRERSVAISRMCFVAITFPKSSKGGARSPSTGRVRTTMVSRLRTTSAIFFRSLGNFVPPCLLTDTSTRAPRGNFDPGPTSLACKAESWFLIASATAPASSSVKGISVAPSTTDMIAIWSCRSLFQSLSSSGPRNTSLTPRGRTIRWFNLFLCAWTTELKILYWPSLARTLFLCFHFSVWTLSQGSTRTLFTVFAFG